MLFKGVDLELIPYVYDFRERGLYILEIVETDVTRSGFNCMRETMRFSDKFISAHRAGTFGTARYVAFEGRVDDNGKQSVRMFIYGEHDNA